MLDGAKGTTDSWSDLILHLLMASLTKRFNRRNVKYEDCPRTSKDMLLMLVGNNEGGVANNDVEVEDKGDDGAISILYLEMAEGKEAERKEE